MGKLLHTSHLVQPLENRTPHVLWSVICVYICTVCRALCKIANSGIKLRNQIGGQLTHHMLPVSVLGLRLVMSTLGMGGGRSHNHGGESVGGRAWRSPGPASWGGGHGGSVYPHAFFQLPLMNISLLQQQSLSGVHMVRYCFMAVWQRAALRYIPETVGWRTMGAILTMAAVSVATAYFLSKRSQPLADVISHPPPNQAVAWRTA